LANIGLKDVVNRIRLCLTADKGYEWIAARMNEGRVASGMGGLGWTAEKVKEAAEDKTPKRLRKREAANGMSALPREACDGLMRAWLKVLHDRHPQVTWVSASARLAQRRS
jgi:hypothetical protein